MLLQPNSVLFTVCSLVAAASLLTPASGLSCYICDSLTEPDCLQNPPDDLKADCAVGRQLGKNRRPPVPDAQVCWTQQQEVGDTNVVVRHCGGKASVEEGDSAEDSCYDRVGSKGVRATYCRCSKDFCNAASRSVEASMLTALLTALLVSGRLLFN